MAERSNKLFGVAGVVMALCCLAGPALLGAAAAIGSALGVVAAVAVALVAVGLLRPWRARASRGC